MPKMPKWLGDFSEKAFKNSYSPVTVVEVQYFAKKLKRIRFQGEALKSKQWIPAQEIEFRINDTDYRHYTPMSWNVEQGYTDVLFYLHNQGVGSQWAEALKVGDELNLIGPAGKFTVSDELKSVVLLGDETTLGAYVGMIDYLPESTQIHCVLEMEKEHQDWAERMDLKAEVFISQPENRGKALADWLSSFVPDNTYNETIFYLSGNVNAIKLMNNTLRSLGISSKRIKRKPYWVEGKKGL